MKSVISLAEAASSLGINKRARADRLARAIITRLEANTGILILVPIGEGKGRRYTVIRRALETAVSGTVKKTTRPAHTILSRPQSSTSPTWVPPRSSALGASRGNLPATAHHAVRSARAHAAA